MKILGTYLRNLNHNDLLVEVGCGSGLLAEKISALHRNMECLDLQDARIYGKAINFKKCNLAVQKMPYVDSTVSLVIATQVLEHLENPTFFIEECHRVLKEDGLLMLSYPNFTNIFQRINILMNGFTFRLGGQVSSGGHINIITSKNLAHWMDNRFYLKKNEGDFFASVKYAPWFMSLMKKSGDKHLIFPEIKSLLLSYNIISVFKKKNI